MGGSARASYQLTSDEKVDLVADILQKQKEGKLGTEEKKKVAQANQGHPGFFQIGISPQAIRQ